MTIAINENVPRSEQIRMIYERKKQRYAEYVVEDVPSPWNEGVESDTVYPQQCFWSAFCYATDLVRYNETGIWLVHGECTMAVGCHAWVELPNGLVFDGVMQQFYRKTDYYDKFCGTPWYRYTPHAAALILCNMPRTEEGEYIYKWNAELGLPWFTGVALEIDFEKAEELIVSSGVREKANRQDAEMRARRRGRRRRT